jgi:hypothetical protein
LRGRHKDLQAGVRLIAEDFRLPNGRRKKIAKLVKEHWGWLEAAQARGMVVEDILAMLTAAGATYDGGVPIKFATLSNAIWRRRAAQACRPEKAPATSKVQKAAGSRRPAGPAGRKRKQASAAGFIAPAQARSRAGIQAKDRELPVQKPVATGSGAGVLKFMRRAAALRRPPDDPD